MLSPSLEDYLEAIAVLSNEAEYVHASTISHYLSKKKSSVTVALRQLRQHQLIEYKPYKPIKLTLLGQEKAFEILQRHTALRDFFITVLHVEPDKANRAACKIEHTIGPEITNKLTEFVRDYKKRELHEI
jgi:DtxR family transcriptional regulator, Mn-dependent transcriptional regulator